MFWFQSKRLKCCFFKFLHVSYVKTNKNFRLDKFYLRWIIIKISSLSINTNVHRIIDLAVTIVTTPPIARAASYENFHFYFFDYLCFLCFIVHTIWLLWYLDIFFCGYFCFSTYFFVFSFQHYASLSFLIQTSFVSLTFFPSSVSMQSKVHFICKYVSR